MFNLFCSLIKYLLLFTFKKRRSLILIILSLKKENDTLKRLLKVSDKTIKTKKSERFILSVLCSISGRVEKHLCIVKPETLLKWQRSFIKKQWTCKRKKAIQMILNSLVSPCPARNKLFGLGGFEPPTPCPPGMILLQT